MNPIEAEYLLTGLKRLLDELKVRKVTAPESIFLGDSDNTYLWTIKKAIWEIWQEAEEIVGPEDRGTKLLTSILSQGSDICDGEEKCVDFDNKVEFGKESGMSTEMRNCVDEACCLVEKCKSMKRELDSVKEQIGQKDKTARQQQNVEKKQDKYITVTLQKANRLHQAVLEQQFVETDAIKANLETKCDGNKLLYSFFLAGNIIQRCIDKLERKTFSESGTQTEQTETYHDDSDRHSTEELKKLLYRICSKTGLDGDDIGNSSLLTLAERINDSISVINQRNADETETMKKVLQNLLQNCHCDIDTKDSSLVEMIENVESVTFQLQKRLEEMKHKAGTYKKEISMLQKEKEDILNRLSQYSSAQLTHDNPNVTDLSDANRPTKLADQFSELYDNQWTDAFDVLKEKYRFDEEKTISGLLFILSQAYDFCLDYSATQERDIMIALSGKTYPITTTVTNPRYSTDLPLEFKINVRDKKIIFDLRKKAVESSSKVVQKEFLKQLKRVSWVDVEEQNLNAYAIACVQLCWCMVLQSPQLCIESTYKPEDNFNTNNYKYYKTKGNKYKFIVWPVLYLHKNGPILLKGVAEAE